MGPYTKHNNSGVIDDGWTIEEAGGHVIAHVDTETMANILLWHLLNEDPNYPGPPSYPEGEPLGEDEGEED